MNTSPRNWLLRISVGIIVGWTILVSPWGSIEERKCRDCLALERKVTHVIFTKTTLERGEFSDWFEARTPNHAHVWWRTRDKHSAVLFSHHSGLAHGRFSLVHPRELLSLATESPSDYDKYRAMILSSDRRKNDAASTFVQNAAFELQHAKQPESTEPK